MGVAILQTSPGSQTQSRGTMTKGLSPLLAWPMLACSHNGLQTRIAYARLRSVLPRFRVRKVVFAGAKLRDFCNCTATWKCLSPSAWASWKTTIFCTTPPTACVRGRPRVATGSSKDSCTHKAISLRLIPEMSRKSVASKVPGKTLEIVTRCTG